MTQYDAGPGDWSDRPWEDPEKKPQPHAKRRRVTLPPWALLVIFVAIVILLCLSLVLIVRAIRGKSGTATPTPALTTTSGTVSPATWTPLPPGGETPTPTVVLPIEITTEPAPPTEIGPGVTVVVQGTGGAGLNVRQQPSTYAKVVTNAKEGDELSVLEGPTEADGYTWWKVRTADGIEGWGASTWMVLKAEQ